MGTEQSRPSEAPATRKPSHVQYARGVARTVDNVSSSFSMCFGPRKASVKDALEGLTDEWVDLKIRGDEMSMKDLSMLAGKVKVVSGNLLLTVNTELQQLKGRVFASSPFSSSVKRWSSSDLWSPPLEQADTVDKRNLGWRGLVNASARSTTSSRQAMRGEVRVLFRAVAKGDKDSRKRLRKVVRQLRRRERELFFLKKQRLQEHGYRQRRSGTHTRRVRNGKFSLSSQKRRGSNDGVIAALRQKIRLAFLSALGEVSDVVEDGVKIVVGASSSSSEAADHADVCAETRRTTADSSTRSLSTADEAGSSDCVLGGCTYSHTCSSMQRSSCVSSQSCTPQIGSIDELHEAIECSLGEDSSLEEGYMPLCRGYSKRTSHWKLGRLLGKGAFGSVFVALVDDGSQIAVKRVDLRPAIPGGSNETSRLAFDSESELLQRLQHPHVVDFLASRVVTNDVALIWMEYVAGGSISCMLKSFGPMREGMVATFAGHTLKGLRYLHQERIVHRDIKPHNLLVTITGVVKLGDFGAAAHIREDQDCIKGVAGTANYMAPEMLQCSRPGDSSRRGGYSFTVDIWSLGITAIEMLTATTPFCEHSNVFAIMFRIARGGPPPMPDNISHEMRAFLGACLDTDKATRAGAERMLQHTLIAKRLATHTPTTTTQRRMRDTVKEAQQQQQQQQQQQLQRSPCPLPLPAPAPQQPRHPHPSPPSAPKQQQQPEQQQQQQHARTAEQVAPQQQQQQQQQQPAPPHPPLEPLTSLFRGGAPPPPPPAPEGNSPRESLALKCRITRGATCAPAEDASFPHMARQALLCSSSSSASACSNNDGNTAPCGPGGVLRRSSRSMAHAEQTRTRKSSSNGRAPAGSASGRASGHKMQNHVLIERVMEEIRARRQDF